MNKKQCREKLLLNIFHVKDTSEVKEYKLTEEDWKSIEEFADQYTANWEWNYGESPKFDLERSERLSVGTVEAKLNVQKGVITEIRLYGDFFGMGEISDVEEKLTGIKYDAQSIREAFEQVDINHYFGNVDIKELVQLLY